MKIDVVTIFPEMFQGPFAESIVKRAIEKKLVEIKIHDLRNWSSDKRRTVDSPPYGGGAGMVMRVDIIDKAITDLKQEKSRVVLLDTKGQIFKQQKAKELAQVEQLILIAGHYEGVDQRVHQQIADEVISIGEFVLTGGELPAMVVVDSVVRLIPGVLGNQESLTEESYNQKGEVEYPQYTRPEEYKGWKVPEILLSGDHEKIREWRKKKY
jgi:tRNA (guanine37-N1)-methyltransferase